MLSIQGAASTVSGSGEIRNAQLVSFRPCKFDAEWHKENDEKTKVINKRYYTETDQIVHALHTDLLICLYRCEVKLGKEMAVVKTQTNDMLTEGKLDLQKNAPGNMTKNLAASLAKKMNQPKTSKSLATSKKSLKDLQHTL